MSRDGLNFSDFAGYLNGYEVNTWRPAHGMLGHSVRVRDQHVDC